MDINELTVPGLNATNTSSRRMIDASEYIPAVYLDPNDPDSDYLALLMRTSTDTVYDPATKKNLTTIIKGINENIEQLSETVKGEPPGDVSGITAEIASGRIRVKWSEPDDTVENGVLKAEWAGTKLVRLTGNYAEKPSDGVVVLDNKERNAFKDTFFTDSGLTDGTAYFYQFFPYSVTGAVNTNAANRFTATPARSVIEALPEQSGALTYNGAAQSPSFSGYDTDKMVLGGVTSGTSAGTYTALFTPTADYVWPDGTDGAKAVSWSIGRAAIGALPEQSGALTYNGAAQSPSFSGYDTDKMVLGGVTSGVNAGSYTAEFTPKANYEWWDGTAEAKDAAWVIGRASIASLPTQSNSLVYNEAEQTPEWNGYDTEKMVIGGDVSGTDVGDYAALFTPLSNYQWWDGDIGAKDVAWSIAARTKITNTPSQSGSITYDGNSKTPSWNNYNASQLTLGGTTSGINAGSYEAEFMPKAGYEWDDGTTAAKTVLWVIDRATIATVPSQSGSITYDGNSKTPSWNNYDSGKMTLGGTTSGTNAGSYTASFAPSDNYKWADGTTAAKDVDWTIGKAAGSLSINPTSLTLDASNLTKTIAVTRAGNGTISAVSSNTGVATVSVNGTTVTVSHKNQTSGTATITVSVAEGANHTAPDDRACAVTASFIPSILNDATWAQLGSASDSGQAANYWSVGDAKQITVNGTIGSTTINKAVWVFILGFDHNSAREGSNKVHFQIGRTAQDYTPNNAIAFIDSGYNSYKASQTSFIMNPSNSDGSYTGSKNAGGWNACTMRTVVLGSDKTPASPGTNTFLAALPSGLRAVMKPCTKYTDNTGGDSNTASYVTATTDYLFLLAEWEVTGFRSYANSAEQNYQQQYAYYSAGNSKVKYKHSATGATAHWWLRSAYVTNETSFCLVNTSGAWNYSYSGLSIGVSPGFCV